VAADAPRLRTVVVIGDEVEAHANVPFRLIARGSFSRTSSPWSTSSPRTSGTRR
jgi:hypothetical protein